MKKTSQRIFTIILVLLMATLACQTFSGEDADTSEPTATSTAPPQEPDAPPPTETPEEPAEPPTDEPPVDEPEPLDSIFPLPPDVQNFTKLSEEQINYQTSMSLEEVVAFYRKEFSAQGLSEYSVTTVIQEEAFSIVFVGSPNGKEIVVQGVKLDEGTSNVNVRYEDI